MWFSVIVFGAEKASFFVVFEHFFRPSNKYLHVRSVSLICYELFCIRLMFVRVYRVSCQWRTNSSWDKLELSTGWVDLRVDLG